MQAVRAQASQARFSLVARPTACRGAIGAAIARPSLTRPLQRAPAAPLLPARREVVGVRASAATPAPVAPQGEPGTAAGAPVGGGPAAAAAACFPARRPPPLNRSLLIQKTPDA